MLFEAIIYNFSIFPFLIANENGTGTEFHINVANLTIYHLLTQLVSLLIFLVEVLQALGVEPVLQHGEGEVGDLIVDIFGLVPAAHDHMSTATQDTDPPLII